jgi:uncharacterized protein (UPF0264 family)
MRLLVSVRDAAEARAAIAGGVDLLDAKEPTAGALGAVSPAVFAAILAATPAHLAVSVALGEVDDPRGLARTITALPFRAGQGPCYAKFALRVADAAAPALLHAAVAASEAHPARPRIIAVTFADAQAAGVVPPIALLRAAARTGVHGLLLDTFTKDGRNLLDFLPSDFLGAWIDGVRTEGLLAAVAGSLEASHVPLVQRMGADVFGVRGAACVGGRSGQVDAARVRALKQACAELAPSSH